MFPDKLVGLIFELRSVYPKPNIYVYTAHMDVDILTHIAAITDGLCVTLHTQEDADKFKGVAVLGDKSMRLNIFEGVKLSSDFDLSKWKVKKDIVWQEDCPLPKDETLYRLDPLWTRG